MKLSKLKYNPENPRRISPEQLDKLVKSIESLPKMMELRPIVYDPNTMYVLGGNQRLAALRKMGKTEIPDNWVKSADEMTEKEKREFILRDNVQSGEWDFGVLDENFADFDLDDIGIELPDSFGIDEPEITEDDYEQPDQIETDIKLGDLFSLRKDGKEIHRLLCGDATKKDDVERLMGGDKADIGITSPPYNAGKNVRGQFYANDTDNKESAEYVSFITMSTLLAINNTKYAFVNLGILESNKRDLVEYQHNLKQYIKDILVWNKSTAPPHINPGTFSTKWEYVFAFAKESSSRAFPCKWQGKYPNVIETENASGNDNADTHKATFPVAFPTWIIDKMDFAQSVLDVFIGTGTTMVACHQLDRKCYGMEIEPTYCQVTLDRMRKLDPDIEVVKIDG